MYVISHISNRILDFFWELPMYRYTQLIKKFQDFDRAPRQTWVFQFAIFDSCVLILELEFMKWNCKSEVSNFFVQTSSSLLVKNDVENLQLLPNILQTFPLIFQFSSKFNESIFLKIFHILPKISSKFHSTVCQMINILCGSSFKSLVHWLSVCISVHL